MSKRSNSIFENKFTNCTGDHVTGSEIADLIRQAHVRNMLNEPLPVDTAPVKRRKIGVRKPVPKSVDWRTMDFHRDGVQVVSLGMTKEELESLVTEFDAAVMGPEIKSDMRPTYNFEFREKEFHKPTQLVGGGFAALGHYSSNMGPFWDDLRLRVRQSVLPLLNSIRETVPKSVIYEYPDRSAKRMSGEKVTAESDHRDNTTATVESSATDPNVNRPTLRSGDIITGGWVSLTGEQKFTFVRGDYTDITNGGFDVSSEEECERDAHRFVSIQVPAGHVIIFNQTIKHRVTTKSGPTIRTEEQAQQCVKEVVMRRLFLAYHVTTGCPLWKIVCPNMREHLRRGIILPLKSCQVPTLWPKLWSVNFKTRVKAFTETVFTFPFKSLKYADAVCPPLDSVGLPVPQCNSDIYFKPF